MNFRITHHCNEALTECKQKNDIRSRNETVAAPGIVAVSIPQRHRNRITLLATRPQLRQSASLEDGCVVAAAARTDEEYHILAALGLRLDLPEVLFTVHRLLVDLENHVTASQSAILAEGIRFHLLHDDTFGVRELVAISHLRRDAPNCDAELALLRLGLLTAFFLIAQTAGKKLGAVSDDYIRRRVLAIANVAQLGVSSRLQRRNLSHQFVASLHWLAVDRNDGVAGFQSSLIGRTVGRNAG